MIRHDPAHRAERRAQQRAQVDREAGASHPQAARVLCRAAACREATCRAARCRSDGSACGPGSTASPPRRPRSSPGASRPGAIPRSGSRRRSAAIRSACSATWRRIRAALLLATGIANIYARDAIEHARHPADAGGALPADAWCSGSASRTSTLVSRVRGHAYQKPVATMRSLPGGDARRRSTRAPKPAQEAPIVLAALRRKMLELAARAGARRTPLLRAARAHRARSRDPRARALAVPGADGAAGDESVAGARARARLHADLHHAPELPEQPARARLQRRGLRGRRQRPAGGRDRRLGR